MNLYAFPPVAFLLDGASRLLMSLTDLLTPVLGGLAAAGAIVLITLAVRAVLIPVGVSQAKAERTRARLAPQLAALQRRHKNDPESLQRATMALYADEGTTPFAGCLPLLAQAPVVGIIYALFIHAEIAGHVNLLLGHALLGAPLGTSLAAALPGGAIGVPLAVVAAIAVVGELTRRAARPGGPLAPATPAAAGSPLTSPITSGLLGLAPFVTAVIACFVPLAAALYLLVTVAWTLAQRVVLRRRYPIAQP